MGPTAADAGLPPDRPRPAPGLGEVAREWGRIGVVGFGGPPAHVSLLRELCVERRRWLEASRFEDAIAATNLLPGPASTQLAIYCAWALRGRAGAVVGGLCFILPGLVLIVALAALFLAGSPPDWLRGAGAGAGAAVAAVAVDAGLRLAAPAWRAPGGGVPRAPGRLRGPGRARRGHPRPLAGAGAARVRRSPRSRGGAAPRRRALSALRPGALLLAAGAATGGLGRAGLDRVQGRRPLVRRRLRDHPADAGRRGRRVRLDDRRRVPERGGAGAGHAGAGGAHGGGRGLRRGRGRRGAAGGAGRLRAVVLVRPARRRPLPRPAGEPRARAFLDGAGPAAIGAILGSAIPLALASGSRGRRPSSRARPSSSSSPAAASC